jgi:hypothetical protein
MCSVRKTANVVSDVFVFSEETCFATENEVIVDREEIELIHLDDLYQLLYSCFAGEELSINTNTLCSLKLQIFEDVINLKLQKKNTVAVFKVAQWQSGQQSLHQIFSNNASKRQEEILKFIMNKFFKYLKKNFTKSQNLLFYDNDKFLEWYFADVAKRKVYPIDYFTFPQLVNDQPAYRLKYFRNLFESQKLREAYREWAAKHLWVNYKKTIKKKFLRLISSWDNKLQQQTKDYSVILKEMSGSFKVLKLRSLPWNKHQVMHAFERVEALLF